MTQSLPAVTTLALSDQLSRLAPQRFSHSLQRAERRLLPAALDVVPRLAAREARSLRGLFLGESGLLSQPFDLVVVENAHENSVVAVQNNVNSPIDNVNDIIYTTAVNQGAVCDDPK